MADIAAPAANPAALGLVGFGLTTVLLSLTNAGVLPAGGEAVVIPLALTYGGLIQIIAGMLEFRLGNTFGMTAFLSYGAFWWWFALLGILAKVGVIDLSGAGPTVGAALLLWGVLTLYLTVSAYRISWLLFAVFMTLWVAFLLLGLGAVMKAPLLHQAGGWVGIVCGALAMYGSFAITANSVFGRVVAPLGARS
jgi:succinate-acetate transporter protein